MPTSPLTSIQNPLTTLSKFGVMLPTVSNAFEFLLIFVFCVWLLYTFVVAYHWIKYNHAPLVTLLVLALHVFVSCALISYGFLINDMLPTL